MMAGICPYLIEAPGSRGSGASRFAGAVSPKTGVEALPSILP